MQVSMTVKRSILKCGRPLLAIGAGLLFSMAMSEQSHAHPHVFIEANLEVVLDANGNATDIRHVWRFDEFFSSSLVLDFDENGSGVLEQDELDMIAKETKISIAEYNFFTEIKNGDEIVEFETPEPYFVDFENNQMIMVMSIKLREPSSMSSGGFKVAVSDPTYYVAMELRDTGSVTVSGNGKGCSSEIYRPDFDALYEKDAERMAKLFDAGPEDEVEASDEYLTWVHFSCKQ